jgi:hypothetical protein
MESRRARGRAVEVDEPHRRRPLRKGAGPSSETVTMLRFLRSSLGAPLTAALTGASGVTGVSAWIAGRATVDSRSEQRLRDAYGVATTLLDAESPETVQAWLLGMNPLLDDRAPAAVLPEDPAAVMRAARFYVANG